MDFTPTEAQDQVRQRAYDFAREVLAPHAEALDVEGGFPSENLRAAAKAGLLGIAVPTDLGGFGAGAVAYSLAVTEMARVCAATTVAICVSNMVAEVINAFGTEEQKQEHIPKLCEGSYAVGAFALSEPGAGSDPGAMLTRARRTDTGWVIDGSKLWITSGTDAGLFVVWARTNDAPGARGISAFLVPGDTPGIVRGKPEEKMGLHGSTTTPLELNECEVPHSALLGDEGKGFRVAMMALDGGRIGIASQALGVGYSALETALEYARTHAEAGVPLAASQGIQWLLADGATELDAARLLTLQAAWRKEKGMPFSREASMAKLWSSEKAFATCNRAIEVMGMDGYARSAGVERNFRDVRVTMIYEGTSEVQRIVIGRDILRRFGGE